MLLEWLNRISSGHYPGVKTMAKPRRRAPECCCWGPWPRPSLNVKTIRLVMGKVLVAPCEDKAL